MTCAEVLEWCMWFCVSFTLTMLFYVALRVGR